MKNKSIIITIVVLLALFGFLVYNSTQKKSDQHVTLGVITDFTSFGAYWGDSTRPGVELAVQDLKNEGYDVSVVFEDYGMSPTKAVSAAQKLVTVDHVDGVYADLMPAAIAGGSFMKDKNILFVYDAAVNSPLTENKNAFKTYLDFQTGCKTIAQKLKDDGVVTLGVLEPNFEPGKLCTAGIKEVY